MAAMEKATHVALPSSVAHATREFALMNPVTCDPTNVWSYGYRV